VLVIDARQAGLAAFIMAIKEFLNKCIVDTRNGLSSEVGGLTRAWNPLFKAFVMTAHGNTHGTQGDDSW
jgi:hypothetical protein